MQKRQAIRFWIRVAESTNMSEVIADFEHQPGYGGKRTLQRYIQAHNGFNDGVSVEEISERTGWSSGYIKKLHEWWTSGIGVKSNTKSSIQDKRDVASSHKAKNSEQWAQFKHLMEIINKLQHCQKEEIQSLIDLIQVERIGLADREFQDELDNAIKTIRRLRKYNINKPELFMRIQTYLNTLMAKKFKR